SSLDQRKNNFGQWFKYLLVIVAIAAGIFLLRNLLKTEIKKEDFIFANVERGDMDNTITATGLVVPSFEQQINAPVSTEIQEILLKSGTQVKPGDLILKLDEEYIKLENESLKDELELKTNNITRLKLEYKKDLNDIDYENQIKGLRLSSLEANLADIRRLKEIGSATQEEVEQAELDVQIEQLEKKKLDNELNFRKQVIGSDERNLELEVMIQKKKLQELARKLKETSVKAPRGGVITWINENIGQKVNEGDPLVRIANLESFRIEGSCSDRYANLVKIGMPVKVRANKTMLDGAITSILPAVENNTVEFIIILAEADQKELRPNMRVEVFIISDKKEDVLKIRNGSAFTGSMDQSLFVVKGNQAKKRKVNIGLSNVNYVEIIGGDVQVGDQVIISDMKDYDHLDVIQLRIED
ncbi:MAG: HlyD family secretion protein, partial [Saprospiraceae bacterium]